MVRVVAGKVNAELPGTAAFASASQYVTEDDIVESIPCGPDPERHLDGIRRFKEAGFTHLALVQIGGHHQSGFIEWSADSLLAAARTGLSGHEPSPSGRRTTSTAGLRVPLVVLIAQAVR